jgi:hypothetical protein
MNHIAEWPSKTLKRYLDYIAVFQSNARRKAQAVGSEEMNVHVTRTAVSIKLEMMMLEIPQAVAHFRLARPKGSRPEDSPVTLDLSVDRYRRKLRIHNEFRS